MSVPDGPTETDSPSIRNGVCSHRERTYIGVTAFFTTLILLYERLHEFMCISIRRTPHRHKFEHKRFSRHQNGLRNIHSTCITDATWGTLSHLLGMKNSFCTLSSGVVVPAQDGLTSKKVQSYRQACTSSFVALIQAWTTNEISVANVWLTPRRPTASETPMEWLFS